jgi:hypothetical protein
MPAAAEESEYEVLSTLAVVFGEEESLFDLQSLGQHLNVADSVSGDKTGLTPLP